MTKFQPIVLLIFFSANSLALGNLRTCAKLLIRANSPSSCPRTAGICTEGLTRHKTASVFVEGMQPERNLNFQKCVHPYELWESCNYKSDRLQATLTVWGDENQDKCINATRVRISPSNNSNDAYCDYDVSGTLSCK